MIRINLPERIKMPKKIYGWAIFDHNKTRPYEVFEMLNHIFESDEIKEIPSLKFFNVSDSKLPAKFNEFAVVIGEKELTEEEARDCIENVYQDMYDPDE